MTTFKIDSIVGNDDAAFIVVSKEPPEESAFDTQVGGDHYKSMPIEPLYFAMKNNLDACQTNIIKYVCRHRSKGGLEDLQKAKHYLDVLIEMEYGSGT